MAKALVEKKIKALEMRKRGMSYSQIKRELKVSKSSLSLWLRKYPLTQEQLRNLQNKRNGRIEVRIEKIRQVKIAKKIKRRREVYERERRYLLPLSYREMYIAGLFLYWGEGLKATDSTVSFTNSDPGMIKFMVRWFLDIIGVPKEKIKVRLQLYKDMSVRKETEFWRELLGFDESQFNKPHIKESSLRSLTRKSFGHGTCDLFVGSVHLKEKIMAGVGVFSEGFRGLLW